MARPRDVRYPCRGRLLASASPDRTAARCLDAACDLHPRRGAARRSRATPREARAEAGAHAGPGRPPGAGVRHGAVTPPAAPDSATDRRTVGDILLARGYITQAQLDHAIAS